MITLTILNLKRQLKAHPRSEFEPIQIISIIANEVGTPRNDGTRGSALYAVPFKLSRQPTPRWADHFVRTWQHPPSYSTRHRPGIARVERDRIILDGTTVEEVAEVHRDTLKLVVAKVNREVEEWDRGQPVPTRRRQNGYASTDEPYRTRRRGSLSIDESREPDASIEIVRTRDR